MGWLLKLLPSLLAVLGLSNVPGPPPSVLLVFCSGKKSVREGFWQVLYCSFLATGIICSLSNHTDRKDVTDFPKLWRWPQRTRGVGLASAFVVNGFEGALGSVEFMLLYCLLVSLPHVPLGTGATSPRTLLVGQPEGVVAHQQFACCPQLFGEDGNSLVRCVWKTTEEPGTFVLGPAPSGTGCVIFGKFRSQVFSSVKWD